MMRAASVLTAVFLAAAPLAVDAAPNAQLVASVQYRLNVLGFTYVDADLLSTRQISALHLELQGREFQLFGLRGQNIRQRVKVILSWDPPGTRD